MSNGLHDARRSSRAARHGRATAAESLEARVLLSAVELLKDIDPRTEGALEGASNEIGAAGGFAYFSPDLGGGLGSGELWRSDGTAAGTVLVKEIEAFPTLGSDPEDFLGVGGTLFFRARTQA